MAVFTSSCESGNFDFSPSGTRYFVLTSVSMKRPFPVAMPMDDYKHDRLEYGLNFEYFHCYCDGKTVRNLMFELRNDETRGFATTFGGH